MYSQHDTACMAQSSSNETPQLKGSYWIFLLNWRSSYLPMSVISFCKWLLLILQADRQDIFFFLQTVLYN